jgi:hypothetical protein
LKYLLEECIRDTSVKFDWSVSRFPYKTGIGVHRVREGNGGEEGRGMAGKEKRMRKRKRRWWEKGRSDKRWQGKGEWR